MMLATGRESTQGYKGLQAINDRSSGKSTKKTRSGIMTIGYIEYNEVIDLRQSKQSISSLRSQIGLFSYFVFDFIS